MLVTVNGHLFSYGSQNENGELGLGHNHPVSVPSEIDILSNARVKTVSCGLNHTMAITKLGQVYTWGKGSKGQLGVGDFGDRWYPVRVKIRGQEKMVNKPK